MVIELFQSLNRAYKRSDLDQGYPLLNFSIRFNPSIGLTSVPTQFLSQGSPPYSVFQSLNRAYKRSDVDKYNAVDKRVSGFNPSIGLTSVPT